MQARLELQKIVKQYPAVLANDAVDLRVMPGEIHAVLGENGAGKSTLMKIIYGAVRPDSGSIMLDGRIISVSNPAAARAMGIAMVFQHFSLFETLTVAENVALGLSNTVSVEQVAQQLRSVGAEYGLEVEPNRPVHTLSVGERQRVEILRALLTNPRVLILDEPTSVLTPQAVQSLFVTLRKLAATGCSILYISHKLDEIKALCSACTVLRSGRVVAVVNPADETPATLSRHMIGAEPLTIDHRPANLGPLALEVIQLTLPQRDHFGTALQSISIRVHAGEILGIAGVSGNGQQELLAVLSGEDTHAKPASVQLFGLPIASQNPQQRRAQGLHFVPEERLGRGALPTMSLAQNTMLTRAADGLVKRGWIQFGATADLAKKIIADFGVKASGPQANASSLSGGNLQKFMVGREVSSNPKVLIIAQPTWGVDVNAAAQIRQALIRLRDQGCAVLVVSEELDELFEISDRLQVIAKGQVSPSITTRDATMQTIGRWMSGLWLDDARNASARDKADHAA